MILGKIHLRDIKREFTAQSDRFYDLGLEMTHIDSHHHIHAFHSIFKIVSNYARKVSLPLRVPWVSYGFLAPTIRIKSLRSLSKKLLLNCLTLKLKNGSLAGIKTPDTFMSIHDYIPFPMRIEHRHYSNLIKSAPAGITEMMVHPAYDTPGLKRLFTDTQIKAQEREVLTRRSLRKMAEEFGFKVVSYRFAEI